MNKDLKIYLILVVIVLLIIGGIFYVKSLFNQNSLTEDLAKCIANKAVLYTAQGCTHCAEQEIILGNYLNLFANIDCVENSAKCNQEGITRYPTWIIEEKKYEGVLTIDQLKQLTGCGCTTNQTVNASGGTCSSNNSNATCSVTVNSCEVKK